MPPIKYEIPTDLLPKVPKYNYGSFIKSPEELDMKQTTDGWGIDTIGSNFGGLMSYIELLLSGETRASRAADLRTGTPSSGQPLGNAYFYPSGLNCKDPDTGQDVSAMMYMNNVPLGNIPFISTVTGDMKQLRGLIPGVLEDLNGFNPMEFLYALQIDSSSECIQVELPITNISVSGDSYKETERKVQYSTYYMFKNYASLVDPCLFQKDDSGVRKNPATGDQCYESERTDEAFTNLNNNNNNNHNNDNNLDNQYIRNISDIPDISKIPDDFFIQLYFIALAILFLFILLKLLHKN